jgi:integral membrane sensor domain MASE1
VTPDQSAGAVRPPRRLPTLHAAFAIFVAYYLGAKIGFVLTPSEQPVSTLWPPNAILLGVLVVARVGAWPIVLASAFLAHLAIELQSGIPIGMALGWFVSNAAEALIGAALMRRVIEVRRVRRAGRALPLVVSRCRVRGPERLG